MRRTQLGEIRILLGRLSPWPAGATPTSPPAEALVPLVYHLKQGIEV